LIFFFLDGFYIANSSLNVQEESADDEDVCLDSDDDDIDDDSDEQEESEDEEGGSKVQQMATARMESSDVTDASASMASNISHLTHEMPSNAVSDTNAICEDSNTEASETPSFPNEEPLSIKGLSTSDVTLTSSYTTSLPSASTFLPLSLATINQVNVSAPHGMGSNGEVACSTCQHPLSLLATAGAASSPIVNSAAAGNQVASTYSATAMHYAHHTRLEGVPVPYSMSSEQFSAALASSTPALYNVAGSSGDATSSVSAGGNQFGGHEPVTSSGVMLTSSESNVATIMSSMQTQQLPPTHQAQLQSPSAGHMPTPSPSSSLTFSQSNCAHGISFATTLAPGTLVVPASNGQLFSLAPTTLDPNNPAVAAAAAAAGQIVGTAIPNSAVPPQVRLVLKLKD
jgi:hypothetical protein